MKRTMLAAVFAATLTALPGTLAADANKDAVEARRSYYQVVKFYTGKLFGIAKGNIAYDAKQAKSFADNLNDLAQLNNAAMWPKGTDNEAMKGKTRALPAIWTTFPKILEKSEAWKSATAELAKVAGDGIDALRSKVGAVGNSCKSCHDTFRAKDF